MARQSNKEERRTEISQALIRVMASQGYDGASIQAIAEAAQLSPGLIHYHFKNKQEILLASIESLVSDHGRRLSQQLALASPDAPSQVVTFLDLHLGLGANANAESLACWVLLSGEALRQPLVQASVAKALSQLTSRLTKILVAGIAKGSICAADAEAAASALVATIQGYYVLAAIDRSLLPRGTAMISALSMAEGLLGVALPRPFAKELP